MKRGDLSKIIKADSLDELERQSAESQRARWPGMPERGERFTIMSKEDEHPVAGCIGASVGFTVGLVVWLIILSALLKGC